MAGKWLLSLAVCSLLLVFTSALESLPLKSCASSPKGTVTSITLDPPPRSDGCTFPKGTNVTAHIKFSLTESAKKLRIECKGQVLGIWVKFNLPNPDACSQGVTCPTTPNTDYTFSTTIPILKEYPTMRVHVEMEFFDDSGSDDPVVCEVFPGAICNP